MSIGMNNQAKRIVAPIWRLKMVFVYVCVWSTKAFSCYCLVYQSRPALWNIQFQLSIADAVRFAEAQYYRFAVNREVRHIGP